MTIPASSAEDREGALLAKATLCHSVVVEERQLMADSPVGRILDGSVTADMGHRLVTGVGYLLGVEASSHKERKQYDKYSFHRVLSAIIS